MFYVRVEHTRVRLPLLFLGVVVVFVVAASTSLANPVATLHGRFSLFRKSTENQLKLVVTSKNRQTDRFVGKIREFFDIVFNTYSPLQV